MMNLTSTTSEAKRWSNIGVGSKIGFKFLGNADDGSSFTMKTTKSDQVFSYTIFVFEKYFLALVIANQILNALFLAQVPTCFNSGAIESSRPRFPARSNFILPTRNEPSFTVQPKQTPPKPKPTPPNPPNARQIRSENIWGKDDPKPAPKHVNPPKKNLGEAFGTIYSVLAKPDPQEPNPPKKARSGSSGMVRVDPQPDPKPVNPPNRHLEEALDCVDSATMKPDTNDPIPPKWRHSSSFEVDVVGPQPDPEPVNPQDRNLDSTSGIFDSVMAKPDPNHPNQPKKEHSSSFEVGIVDRQHANSNSEGVVDASLGKPDPNDPNSPKQACADVIEDAVAQGKSPTDQAHLSKSTGVVIQNRNVPIEGVAVECKPPPKDPNPPKLK